MTVTIRPLAPLPEIKQGDIIKMTKHDPKWYQPHLNDTFYRVTHVCNDGRFELENE